MYWDTVTGGFDAELTSNIGAGTPSGIKITGYMNGANDAVRVQMWDYQAGTPAWVTIGSWSGGGSTVNQPLPYDAFVGMVGTAGNLGDIRLRLYNDNGVVDTALTSANIYIDQVFVEFNEGASSSLDAVYFDSNASNTGTTAVDGLPGNPVSTEAAVNTLLASRNLHKVEVALESSVTFATSHIDEVWTGRHWTCDQGGQNLSGSHIEGADVTGIATASVERIDYKECSFGTCTVPQMHAESCGLTATVAFGEAGDYIFNNCHSAIAGASTPIIDTGAAIANVNLAMPDWHNGIEIANLNAAGTDLFSISGIGQIIYSASSSGAVNQRGRFKLTNTGGVIITYDDPSQNEINTLADTADMQPRVVAIELDTDELQTDWTTGGRLDLLLDQVITDISNLNNISAAQVNAEMVDVLATDTYAETTVPAATASLAAKIQWLATIARNKITQTATTQLVRNDADSATLGTSTVSDDGTTFTRGEFL